MNGYIATDGTEFNDDDLERWAKETEDGVTFDHLGPAQNGKPTPAAKRDYHRRLSLNYRIIADAQDHYAALNYQETAIPWVITEEAYLATLPPEVKRFASLGGYLPGSAEQSFIHLLLDGENPGRAQATSPCFRDEDHDEIHSPYFFKLELFDNRLPATEEGVLLVLNDAKAFFERYLPVKVIPEGELAWDIVAAHNGLELGSYGVRNFRDFSWIYGTGVALPRLEQAVESFKLVR